jgi:phosphatidylinositol alpha-1,6-mannosyltransferase
MHPLDDDPQIAGSLSSPGETHRARRLRVPPPLSPPALVAVAGATAAHADVPSTAVGADAFPRTLVLTGHLAPRRGGVESFTEQLARRLPAESVVMMAPEMPGCAVSDATLPWEVIRYPGRLVTSPGLAMRVSAVARSRGIQAAWITSAMPLGLLAIPLRRAGVASLVISTHGMEVGWASVPPAALMMRAVARRVELVTYLGDITHDGLRPALPTATATMRLTGGVDTDRFTPGARAVGIRRRLGWEANPIVVSASRLVPRKGQDVLLQAWPEICRRHGDARLLIVGEGRRRSDLERAAAGLIRPDEVHFAGSVSDDLLPAYLAAGDVFALPCRDMWHGLQVEGLGLSILEASAVGLPVVVGRSGGTPDAVLDGVTGQLVDGSSATGVAAAVGDLLNDPDRARLMGAAGREWVSREWSWDLIGTRLRTALGALHEAAVRVRATG